MDQLLLRERHGDVFASNLPDGQSIPWRPLTIGEFIHYDEMVRMGRHPQAYLEDEVFNKCVLDPTLVENTKILKAGTIPAVVTAIVAYSGPQNVSEINRFLEISRQKAAQIIHQLVSVITQGFPAYKPEDIYEMDYTTFMLRVAQAEEKLVRTGILQEPLSIQDPDQKQDPKKPRMDSKKLFDQQQQGADPSQQPQEKITNYPDPPPIPDPGPTTIITKDDILEHSMADDHDPVDGYNKAQETAEVAFTDYLDQMKRGETVKILTPEERKAAAEIRSEITKKQTVQRRQEMLKSMAEERKGLLKVREKARERKKRKLAAKQ